MLAFNSTIGSIHIHDKIRGEQIKIEKEKVFKLKNNLSKVHIKFNDQTIQYLKCDQSHTQIAVRIDESGNRKAVVQEDKNLPVLYADFPLMGS